MSLSPKPRQLVDNFGIHKDTEGYSWLIQQGSILSAIGLPEKHCPFKIKTPLMMCPHKFEFGPSLEGDPILNEYESRLKSSEILQAFDPVYAQTDSKTLYISIDGVKQYNSILKLQQLMNPSIALALPAGLAKEQVSFISKRLKSSRLVTYVIYGLKPVDLKLVDDMANMSIASLGRLVLVGEAMSLYNTKDLIKVLRAESSLFSFIDRVSDKKLREIGSHRVKKFMRS